MILTIDFDDPRPIFLQVRDGLVWGIATGQLQAGEQLPSVRQLAEDLGVNLHTANKAYQALREEGLIHLNQRSGAVVKGMEAPSGEFRRLYGQRIRLLAAEARCHGLDEDAFLDICRDALRALREKEGNV